MNNDSSQLRESIAWIGSASDVVARVYSGDLSDEEVRQIEFWLKSDRSHPREFQDALDAWENIPALLERLNLEELAMHGKRNWLRRRVVRGVGMTLAASLILGMCANWFFGESLTNGFGVSREQVYLTQVGERRTLSLTVGTEVTLNTNSRITVSYRNDVRDIKMEYGEAFFDVHEDPERPLQLRAGSSVVTVLGTKFNVHWTGPNVTIAVVEGLVAVGTNAMMAEPGDNPRGGKELGKSDFTDSEVLLESGSIAVFSEESKSIDKKYAPAMDGLQSWRFGFLKFDNAPLYKVVGELNRYSATKILIEDKGVMEMPVSGIFSLDDVDKILQGLEAALPIEINRRFDGHSIVGVEPPDSV